MPEVDVAEEVFLTLPRQRLVAACSAPELWDTAWRGLVAEDVRDRGVKGTRWVVGGTVSGTMEVWLEPVLDGTVVHYFLRGELVSSDETRRDRPGARRRRVRAEVRRRRLAVRQWLFELKVELEAGRAPGRPPREPIDEQVVVAAR